MNKRNKENIKPEPIISLDEFEKNAIDIEPEEVDIPEEPRCGWTDDGCYEPDSIICEDCGEEFEDGEEHDCSGGKEPEEIEEEN